VRVRLEKQLDAVRNRGRNDRQPSEFPQRRIYFLDEAQDLRVELEGLGLIVRAFSPFTDPEGRMMGIWKTAKKQGGSS